jgi:hypothetical protein
LRPSGQSTAATLPLQAGEQRWQINVQAGEIRAAEAAPLRRAGFPG